MSAPTVVPARPHRATELLTALGTTKEEVAASLRDAGTTGRRGDACRCPLAVFLLKSDLGLYDIVVGYSVATLWFRAEDGAEQVEVVDLPDPCRELARAFDEGSFRFLLAEVTR